MFIDTTTISPSTVSITTQPKIFISILSQPASSSYFLSDCYYRPNLKRGREQIYIIIFLSSWFQPYHLMQLTTDSNFSPTHKHRLSPQMSRSHIENISSNKTASGYSQISPNRKKIDLHLMRSKISDVEKMLKTREREYLSPNRLRSSYDINNPQPKAIKQNYLSPNAQRNHDNKPLDREQLCSSWSDHHINMLQESITVKDDKNVTISPKKQAVKISQAYSRANGHERKERINEQKSMKNMNALNLLEIPKIERLRKEENESNQYRFSFLTNVSSSATLQLQKKLRNGKYINRSQFVEDRKDDKVRMHINRTQEVLELIKREPLQRIKEQKRSGILEYSKKVLCGFQLGRPLGKGKFGHVYLAKHIQTGFLTAIKKIEKAKIRQFNMISQFTKEIKLHNSLDHPKIVKFYGFFQQQRDIYLVLEYMNGGTLFEYLNKVGFLGIKETVDLLRDIILAIAYLHERSIAHRDIKPQNIVISTEGVAKLCDFGWSSIIDSMRHTYCGTLDYASPEILQRKEYDLSVDIWSIGILTFEMLMGKAPFQDKNRSIVKQKILNVDKMEFNYARNIPDQAKEFIEALVQKDPAKRPKITQLLNFKLFSNYGSKTVKKT